MRRFLIISVFTFCLFLMVAVVSGQNLIDDGKQLLQAGRYDEAKEIFEQVLESNSHDAAANYFMGRIYLDLGNYDRSKDHLEKAVRVDDENIDYHLSLAKTYGEKTRRASFLTVSKWAGKWKRELERAVEIDSTNIDARRRLVNYYLNAPSIGGGDKKKGKMLAEETIELDEVEGRLLLAYAFKRGKKLEQAILEYERVIGLDPQNGTAYNSLGYIYLEQKDYDAAGVKFKKYIEVAPNDANAYDSMGDFYSEFGKIDEAIAQYEKALETDPKFSGSRFKLGQAYEEKQMEVDAVRHYETLLELTPDHIRAKDAEKRLKKLKR